MELASRNFAVLYACLNKSTHIYRVKNKLVFFSGNCIRLCLFLKGYVDSICRDTVEDDLLVV